MDATTRDTTTPPHTPLHTLDLSQPHAFVPVFRAQQQPIPLLSTHTTEYVLPALGFGSWPQDMLPEGMALYSQGLALPT